MIKINFFRGLIFLVLNNFSIIFSSRILFVPGHSGASHTKSMHPSAEFLKKSGHDVHILQIIDDDPSQECRNKNGVVDRIVNTISNNRTDFDTTVFSKLIWSPYLTNPFGIIFPWKMTTEACTKILSHETTRKQIEEIISEKWHAIIIDDFFNACGLWAMKHKWIDDGIVIVDFSTTVLSPASIEPRGITVSKSVAVSFREPIYENKNFWYRFWMTWDLFQYRIATILIDYLIPYWGRGSLARITPSILHDHSVLAVSSVAIGLDFVHPQTLDIGDLDLACPSDSVAIEEPFKTFLDDSQSRGTIVFATGHYVDWNFAPPGVMEAFVAAFARLPQYRIIWQFVSKSIKPENLTSNVLLKAWIPQAAILNHEKTKLFLSHMGLKSMRESICARVPTLGMPMFAEQYRNTAISRYRKFGLFLDKMNLTEQTIYESIKHILDNHHRFENRATRLQNQLNDRLRNSNDLFKFRLEFFMRWNKRRVLKKFIQAKCNVPNLFGWLADILFPSIIFIFLGFVLVS